MEQIESRKIALRYAKALLEAAQEQRALDSTTESIRQLQGIYLEVPELSAFFTNPGIPAPEKQSILEKQFKKGIAPMVGNLLDLLASNERIGLLPEVMEGFIQLVKEKEGIASAEVTVPVAMSAGQENRLRTALEGLFGYQQVELSITVDPAIIAGVVVKVGDKLIDGSYHGKLEMLRRQVG